MESCRNSKGFGGVQYCAKPCLSAEITVLYLSLYFEIIGSLNTDELGREMRACRHDMDIGRTSVGGRKKWGEACGRFELVG